MWFWIFMLVMLFLTPSIMIMFGLHFIKSAPKEINQLYGYRSSMSMKNKDTWNFAHNYCGRLWYNLGRIILPLTTLPMLLVLNKSEDTIGYFSLILSVIQIICLIGAIFPTERALKKVFDENGIRRKRETD